MSERVYVVAEGWHDVEFIKRILLGHFGLVEVVTTASPGDDLAAWHAALSLPERRPPSLSRRSDDATDAAETTARPPTFLHSVSSGTLVALSRAGGVTRIVKRLDADLIELESIAKHRPTAIGIVVDADGDASAQANAMATSLRGVGRPAPSATACVDPGPPRLGLYVLPGEGPGTKLESLLIDAAGLMWPALAQAASSYIDNRDTYGLDPIDLAGFDREKATTATIAAILAPKRQPMVALRDSRWLDAIADPTRPPHPRVAPFLAFLSSLLATAPTSAS